MSVCILHFARHMFKNPFRNECWYRRAKCTICRTKSTGSAVGAWPCLSLVVVVLVLPVVMVVVVVAVAEWVLVLLEVLLVALLVAWLVVLLVALLVALLMLVLLLWLWLWLLLLLVVVLALAAAAAAAAASACKKGPPIKREQEVCEVQAGYSQPNLGDVQVRTGRLRRQAALRRSRLQEYQDAAHPSHASCKDNVFTNLDTLWRLFSLRRALDPNTVHTCTGPVQVPNLPK